MFIVIPFCPEVYDLLWQNLKCVPCQLLPMRFVVWIVISLLLRLADYVGKLCFLWAFFWKPLLEFMRLVCAFRDFSPARMSNLWKSGHLAFEQLPISKNSFRKIIQITAGLILTITLKAEKLEMSVSVCRYMYTHKTVLYQVLGLKQIFHVSVFDWVDTFYFIFSSSKWTLLSPMAAFAAINSVPLPLGWCLEWHQSVYCWIQPKIIPQTQQRESISLWLVMRVREQVF